MALPISSKDCTNNLNPMCFTNEIAYGIFERLRLQRVEGKYCDVVIVAKERQFAAHRNVLSACSPFFESILHNNKIFKEKISVRIDDPEAFELFLNFLYGATITIDRRTVGSLLMMSNNFLVARLRTYCIEYLQKFIDNANCLFISRLAEKCNLSALFKHSTSYLENNVDSVLMESVDLLNETATSLRIFIDNLRCRLNVNAEAHFRCLLRWVGHNLLEREHDFYDLIKTCEMHRISETRLHALLDASMVFKQSRKCMLDVLHFMYEDGIPLGKFESDYGILLQACQESELYFCDKEQVAPQYLYENTNGIIDPNGDEDESETDDLMNNYAPALVEAPSERPKLKLKINLGAASPKKSISKDSTIPRRRGRPPKPRPAPAEVNYENINEEPDERFFQFDEAGISTFDEPDDFNPDHLIEDAALGEIASTVCGVESQEAEAGELSCEHCLFKTMNPTILKRHLSAAHSHNVLYCCNICGFECKWNRAFYDHVRAHFPGPPFRCDSCEYTVDRIHVLLTHRLTHSDDRPFKCQQCDFRCLFKSNLILHNRLHSGEKPYHCPDCNKAFALKHCLQKHMIVHSDDRPYSCRECDFTAKYQSELIAHRRNHSGDLFFCQQAGCTYSSPKKSQLAAHLRTHLAVRSHQCQICKRSFIEKSHLVRHERIHLVEKPFKCENCDYASSRRDKLKEHILKHHNAQQSPKTHRRRFRRAKQVAQLAAQAIDSTRLQVPPMNEDNYFQPIDESASSSQQQQQPPPIVHNVPYDNNIGNDGIYGQNTTSGTNFITSEAYAPMEGVSMMPAANQPSSSNYLSHDDIAQSMNNDWPLLAPMRPASETLRQQQPQNPVSPSPSLNFNLQVTDEEFYPRIVQQQQQPHLDDRGIIRDDLFFNQLNQHKDDLVMAGLPVELPPPHIDSQRPLSLPSYAATPFFVNNDGNSNQLQQFMHPPSEHLNLERYLQTPQVSQATPSNSDSQKLQGSQEQSPIRQRQQPQQSDQWWP